MERVGVCTRPQGVKRKPPLLDLKPVSARDPLMPISQSASERQMDAASRSFISESGLRFLNPSLIASFVMLCSQRRLSFFLIGLFLPTNWRIYRKISSPSLPASQPLIISRTSRLRINLLSAL